jgi:enoyl-CoA hydratase/carnithine racemase
LWRELYALLQAIASSPVPIVAAITGHAPAGGTVLALFCDYRIMAQGDFKLGLNEVVVGIPLPPVILGGLRRLVGARQAERLGVSGALLSPEQALAVGLVDEVAPAEQVVERARDWCMQMLALPHEAMTVTRRVARVDMVDLFGSEIDSELGSVIESWWSPSTQSTLRALVDRLKKKAG